LIARAKILVNRKMSLNSAVHVLTDSIC